MKKNVSIERQLAAEIKRVLHEQNRSQTDLAKGIGVGSRMVSAYLCGRRSLLTGSARSILEELGVRIRLEVIPFTPNTCGSCRFYEYRFCKHPSNKNRPHRVRRTTPGCPSWQPED